MLPALYHATLEACVAAAHVKGCTSRAQVAVDFIASRLLRYVRLPNYNVPRCIVLDGLTMHYRFNRGDLQSLKEVFLDRAYEVVLPFQPRTILDLGANIGLASLWLGKRYSPRQSIAVEAAPDNAAVARMNQADNGIAGEVLCAAVGASSGVAWFQSGPESNLGALVLNPAGKNPTRQRSENWKDAASSMIEVPVIGIAELIRRFGDSGVDLIKMDIEGAEESLLGGDLSWLDSVKALLVEFHDDRVNTSNLIRRVEAAGFHHKLINQDRQDNLSAFLRS